MSTSDCCSNRSEECSTEHGGSETVVGGKARVPHIPDFAEVSSRLLLLMYFNLTTILALLLGESASG
jgi:hypothetical protein